MKLFTLIAGYAAGLAVAMKYRKNKGTALPADASKSKVDRIVDEIVDIHKTAYKDARSYVEENFHDVHDFDSLKSKVSPYIDNFTHEAEALFESVSEKWTAKKAALQSRLADLVAEKKALLDAAKTRGEWFSDVAADTIAEWIESAREKLEWAHATLAAKIDTVTPAKKPATKRTTPKKTSPVSAPKKTPAKKPTPAKKTPVA